MTPPGNTQWAAEAARREYVAATVLTATPEKLVVLLYDGAIQSLNRAESALLAGRRQIAGVQLRKALAIVGELRASLDLEEGGDIARNLWALYGFATDRIIRATSELDAAPVAEARTVLSKLKEGWDGIARAG